MHVVGFDEITFVGVLFGGGDVRIQRAWVDAVLAQTPALRWALAILLLRAFVFWPQRPSSDQWFHVRVHLRLGQFQACGQTARPYETNRTGRACPRIDGGRVESAQPTIDDVMQVRIDVLVWVRGSVCWVVFVGYCWVLFFGYC